MSYQVAKPGYAETIAAEPEPPRQSATRRRVAVALVVIASAVLVIGGLARAADVFGWSFIEDRDWRIVSMWSWRAFTIAAVAWFVAIDVAMVLALGQRGQRRIFVLPAVQITLAVVIFPTIFGIYVSFTDWQLNDPSGRAFTGLDNFRKMINDDRFWNALKNNFIFVGFGVPFQYVIALALAVLVNQDIRGRKFFRVAFLLPFMLSPVAAGWMIGRSIFDVRWGPMGQLLELVGSDFVFYDTGTHALISLILIDSWYSIPFLFVLLLAGLQAMPHEVMEAARIDGAGAWQTFRDMTFPLLLPVSLTAVVLRAVFEFKLIDIILVVTGGGPGDATETLTAYIYREGYQGLNVGYATAMAEVFLIVVIAFIVLILVTVGRKVRDVAY